MLQHAVWSVRWSCAGISLKKLLDTKKIRSTCFSLLTALAARKPAVVLPARLNTWMLLKYVVFTHNIFQESRDATSRPERIRNVSN